MWTERLINAGLGMTAAVAVVWLATLILSRASAALRHSLWRLALVAFWVLPLVLLLTSGMAWRHVEVPLAIPAALPALTLPATPAPDLAPSPGSSVPAPSAPRRPLPLGGIVLALWALGALAGLARLTSDALAARRLRAGCAPVDDPAAGAGVAEWSARLGLRRPLPLARCAQVAVPTVVGARRPVLLLPPAFPLTGPGFDAVAVHELAHVRRGDVAAQLLARLTCALWWWHPLAWLTARELRQTAEEACDDWAVSLTNQPHPYADLLVHWATTARPQGNLACLHPGKALLRRVRRVLSGVAQPARLGAGTRVALVACGVAVQFGLTAVRVHVFAGPLFSRCLTDRHESDWTRALWVRLSDQEAVEYGWETRIEQVPQPDDWPGPWVPPWKWKIRMFYHCFIWHRGEEARKFYICVTDYPMDEVDIRSTPDLAGLWVFDRGFGHILCSLDRRSGEYLGENGFALDWHDSIDQQEERALGGQKQHWAWRNPKGGVLLGATPPRNAR